MSEVRKLLDIPDGPRTKAFRAFEQVLRDAPQLMKVVNTWRTREGHPAEDYAEPSHDQCPIIGLSPAPRADRNLTIESATIQMELRLEVFVQGSCIDDALNLWDLICEALRLRRPYRDGTVFEFLRCKLDEISITEYAVAEPAFEPYNPSMSDRIEDFKMMRGEGRITFNFIRPR